MGVFGFAIGVGTAPGMAVMDDIVKANAVWVGTATGSPHWTQPLKKNVFGVYPLYPDEAAILANYPSSPLKRKRSLSSTRTTTTARAAWRARWPS